MKLLCWNCGTSLDDVPRPISRHAACAACFNELHCCRLCHHYDPRRSMHCFEDRAEPPLQKENANFCDFFTPSANVYNPKTSIKSTQAKEQLTSLFGDDDEEAATPEKRPEGTPNGQITENYNPLPITAEEHARKKLDDLFN